MPPPITATSYVEEEGIAKLGSLLTSYPRLDPIVNTTFLWSPYETGADPRPRVPCADLRDRSGARRRHAGEDQDDGCDHHRPPRLVDSVLLRSGGQWKRTRRVRDRHLHGHRQRHQEAARHVVVED